MNITRPFGVASALLLSACAHTQGPINLSAESRCPVSLTPGQSLSLSLASNPSTGFRWEIKEPAANTLRSLGPELYTPDSNDEVVGAGGTSVWRFVAQTPGQERLLLTYQQPWDTQAAPAQQFDCTIIVK